LIMRLFVAVEFDSGVKASISALQGQLRLLGVTGSFSGEENFHLTLKFLGETEQKLTGDIKAALDCAALAINPFEISAGHCGSFSARGEKTIWLGMDSPFLVKIAGEVDRQTAKLGFERENRAFTPHVTLARRALCSADALAQLNVPEIKFKVTCITLFESRRDAGKLSYKPIYRAILKECN